MRNMLLGLVALFFFGALTTFSSCQKDEEDDGGCTVCTYVRPDNSETVVPDPLCRDTDAELDDWEEIFRNEVHTAAEGWENVEITCERD